MRTGSLATIRNPHYSEDDIRYITRAIGSQSNNNNIRGGDSTVNQSIKMMRMLDPCLRTFEKVVVWNKKPLLGVNLDIRGMNVGHKTILAIVKARVRPSFFITEGTKYITMKA